MRTMLRKFDSATILVKNLPGGQFQVWSNQACKDPAESSMKVMPDQALLLVVHDGQIASVLIEGVALEEQILNSVHVAVDRALMPVHVDPGSKLVTLPEEQQHHEVE